jgi:uncharacterized membrane protein
VEPACRAGHGSPYFGHASNVSRRNRNLLERKVTRLLTGPKFVIALGSSLLLSCIIISAGKFYWWDELFPYYLIEAPTLGAMFKAYNDKINNTPVVYFFIGWLWAQMFGASELSLRILSSLTFCLALTVTYALLIKRYHYIASALGTASVFGLSIMVLDQNAEARMYGLYLAFVALALLLFDKA